MGADQSVLDWLTSLADRLESATISTINKLVREQNLPVNVQATLIWSLSIRLQSEAIKRYPPITQLADRAKKEAANEG